MHPRTRQTTGSHVGADRLTEFRQAIDQFENTFVLFLVAVCAPLLVVDVLATARVIHSYGLDVAVRVWADPHVPPRRRDQQALGPAACFPRPPRPVPVPGLPAFASTPPR